MELHFMQFSATSYYFIPLTSKYSPLNRSTKWDQMQVWVDPSACIFLMVIISLVVINFHGEYLEHICFVVLTAVVIKISIFWGITPYSPLKIDRRFGQTRLLHLQGLLATSFHVGFLFGLFFDPEIEATCSSEKSVDSQRTTRRYIPEDRSLHTWKIFLTFTSDTNIYLDLLRTIYREWNWPSFLLVIDTVIV
jgi:hypothetical protein